MKILALALLLFNLLGLITDFLDTYVLKQLNKNKYITPVIRLSFIISACWFYHLTHK